MSIHSRRTDTFLVLKPPIQVYNQNLSAAVAEQTLNLSGVSGLTVPTLTAAIRVYGIVSALAGGFGSVLRFRDYAGGLNVAAANSTVVGQQAYAPALLDLNGGQVTFSADPGTATSYNVQIYVTGFLRYA